MARIIILGNRNSAEVASQTGGELLVVPDIYENDFGVVNDFVKSRLKEPFDILIIDADNIQRADVALAFGMYLRLSFTEVGVNALAPIIIASDFTIKKFLHVNTYSQLLLSGNVYFQNRREIITEAVVPLPASRYEEDFLGFVSIQPGPEIGRHSLANQWGASVIDRLLNNGTPSGNEVLGQAAKSLYFKYVFAQTVNVSDVLSGKPQTRYNMMNRMAINAKGKRILLIDDEADRGWEYVLKQLVNTNEGDFDVIGHRVKSYDAFSKEERQMIENGNYDLIFLDLRMNGVEEENVYKPEEFSGMKILKRIKKDSPGTQIIMFTASNKAWNLKALLDEGADGYYIKESPEYKFSFGFSIANYDALRTNIQECLRRSYLREVNRVLKSVRSAYTTQKSLQSAILHQLSVSYVLLEAKRFEFAFVTLCQIIELINDEYLEQDADDAWYIKETKEYAKSWKTNFRKECVEDESDTARTAKYPEWQKAASLYYQLWSQADKSFGYQLKFLIDERNKFMHNDSNSRSDIHTEKGYMSLLSVVETMCSFI